MYSVWCKTCGQINSLVKMIVNIHNSPDGKKIIAMCDKDILGKKFEEGKRQLDLASNFYAGKEMTEEELLKNMGGGSYHINAVGKESIGFCIKQKLIDEENIMTISDIPYAQASIIRE